LSSHFQIPYKWTRQGNTYTNAFYGVQITKKDGWLRHIEGSTLGSRLFLSRLFSNPLVLIFPKRNLIEFHRFGDTQSVDAAVAIGPVDNLKGKPYGHYVDSYAHASLESVLAPRKIWLKKGEIELMELNGMPCAKATVSSELPKVGELKSEFYFFIRGGKGFNINYTAKPLEFDKYRDEATRTIQSVRFESEQTTANKYQ